MRKDCQKIICCSKKNSSGVHGTLCNELDKKTVVPFFKIMKNNSMVTFILGDHLCSICGSTNRAISLKNENWIVRMRPQRFLINERKLNLNWADSTIEMRHWGTPETTMFTESIAAANTLENHVHLLLKLNDYSTD